MKKSHLQHARIPSFINEAKARRPLDKDDYSRGDAFGYFLRNPVRINVFSARNASMETHRIIVIYNTLSSPRVKKSTFFDHLPFGERNVAEASQICSDSIRGGTLRPP
jgi:hypothetical protein